MPQASHKSGQGQTSQNTWWSRIRAHGRSVVTVSERFKVSPTCLFQRRLLELIRCARRLQQYRERVRCGQHTGCGIGRRGAGDQCDVGHRAGGRCGRVEQTPQQPRGC
eukprot:363711-Chlamydomonas_euryale.AAC.15